MAIKKSELYSSLWASCDELRGGMDASQYKDYVLVFLFLKYISDKYAGQPFAPITIPAGASFADMAALKGSKDIGDQINKAIIAPLVEANQQLSLSDFPDFNDPNKLGSNKEMVDRLTNLIGIFEEPALDFSKNRAEGDDILGDAYEYLMRHFATESGKSKGQFYTPSEVSRIMAKVLDIGSAQTSASTTVYDPTCGSGSLLLKVADEASSELTLYGQEKDATTSGLARMNMILHNNPTAEIAQGNTLADPKFLEGASLKQFDYVVANPPFSDKRWSTGVHTTDDPHERFKHFGTPPDKQGDYAYLLHILRSLKSTGKGACILPHGVLFRGNAEAEIRKKLIRKGYLKAIIGLPANLFYGTGIPACILVLDKSEAHARKGIFMVDASNGFIKDGNKNRLRSRDIHQIVDAYSKGVEVKGYARSVGFEEIEKNDFNLNLPRYIDNRAAEDLQDIEAHLQGGIPARDVDALEKYWAVCPNLRASLFQPLRDGYVALNNEARMADGKSSASSSSAISHSQLQAHPDLVSFRERLENHFQAWADKQRTELRALAQGFNPKTFIHDFSEDLLAHYQGQPLIDPYAVYQHLMDYWSEVLQDDTYLIAIDGWQAKTYRITETNKKTGKTKDKGWACDLVPKELIVARYFAAEQARIESQQAELEALEAQRAELEEEHSAEDGAFAELDKINKAEVSKRLKELKAKGPGIANLRIRTTSEKADQEISAPSLTESEVLQRWLDLNKGEAALKKAIKDAELALDVLAYEKYPKLTEAEIQTLAVDDKWLATLQQRTHSELDRITQALTQRVKQLAERYEAPLSALTERTADLEAKVSAHLKQMGFNA
ncbi:type I restriction-modification system subunit M [Coraliomargarita sp. SDUM461003]|uniref:site-specific DNA-methyltransferase (adenine-specific) n=1 Tax=Thalassobacterium maritimum TaxID=3041265 RepID=A0ABU1AS25_9BACT|nr:type I restriction-modification system subunit M [Coraliomargarita sp. SDUM461003]MDQ8206959.1 type I restriction-modification system subunit M [Coraliomargarita sp. SDUM461003]